MLTTKFSKYLLVPVVTFIVYFLIVLIEFIEKDGDVNGYLNVLLSIINFLLNFINIIFFFVKTKAKTSKASLFIVVLGIFNPLFIETLLGITLLFKFVLK